METIITQISKILMIVVFALYTYECFSVIKRQNQEIQEQIFKRQTFFIFLLHLNGFALIFLHEQEMKLIIFYLLQVILLSAIIFVYGFFYPTASRLVVNNMCMLLSIGFIILTRLDYAKAMRQFEICVAATILCTLIPLIIHKLKFLRNLTWLYALVGIAALGVVLAVGDVSYGAKLFIKFGGISLQPSEFVKITYVFFISSMLYRNTSFKQVVVTTCVAALHVLILVASRDLGGALILFVTYLVMVYVATRKLSYFGAGLGGGVVASIAAYFLFNHVRVRVLAWKDPFAVIDGAGYQVAQSLFAIGTGGWFGLGLYQGMPDTIPVVEQDFIFSAISEEMGGIFAICLILVCACCFLMFLNIALQIKNQFYKLIALGLGTVYGFQVFLTIGGVTKFIPSTGVTLPLVSYGGSSLLSTIMIFSIIQGLYILREDEEIHGTERNETERQQKKYKRSSREAH